MKISSATVLIIRKSFMGLTVIKPLMFTHLLRGKANLKSKSCQ